MRELSDPMAAEGLAGGRTGPVAPANPMAPPRRAPRRPDERGSILPLIIGFGIIIMLLCAVVFDSAQAFVYRRGLNAIADGAALAATNGIDKAAIYSGGVEDHVLLSQELAQEEVTNYVAQGGYDSVQCGVTALNAAEVTVTCDGEVVLPIANAISGGQASLGIRVQANAETFAVPGP
jgi:hypothetical protein